MLFIKDLSKAMQAGKKEAVKQALREWSLKNRSLDNNMTSEEFEAYIEFLFNLGVALTLDSYKKQVANQL